MDLEAKTVWLVAGTLSTSFGLLVMVLRSRYPGYLGRAFDLWGRSCLCMGVAFWLASGSQRAALSLLSPSIGIVTITLQYLAVTELKQQRRQALWTYVPLLAICAVYLWFGLLQPNITVGLFLINLVRMAFLLRISVAFFQRENGLRPFMDTLAASAYLLVALSALALIAAFLHTDRFSGAYNFASPRTGYTVTTIAVAQAVLFSLFILAITERLNDQLKQQAMHDPLTGLFNRRAIEEIGLHQNSHALRSGHAFAVFMIDVDHFKQVNDEFGHAAGDAILKLVAAALGSGLRNEDYLGRWGGDEFCVLLPGATPREAEAVAIRVREILEQLEITMAGRPVAISVSMGIASIDENISGFDTLMARADAALYEAKRTGRNRYSIAALAQDHT